MAARQANNYHIIRGEKVTFTHINLHIERILRYMQKYIDLPIKVIRKTRVPSWLRSSAHCSAPRMQERRLTTVHDVAALRVHPDGTRVAADGNEKRKRKDKLVVQDQRGNWSARDAAGLHGIKRRRGAADDEQDVEPGEVFDLTGVGELMKDTESPDKGKRKADSLEQEPGPSRKKLKRRVFLEDLSFLDVAHAGSSRSSTVPLVVGETTSNDQTCSTAVNPLPNPSSVSTASDILILYTHVILFNVGHVGSVEMYSLHGEPVLSWNGTT